MSSEKYIKETLTMPTEMPFFNYNFSFKGLTELIEDIEVKTNSHAEHLKNLDESLEKKLPKSAFIDLEKRLGSSIKLGLNSQKLADSIYQRDEKGQELQLNKKEMYELEPAEQYSLKMKQLSGIIEHLVFEVDNLKQKVSEDDKRVQKLIDSSFRRIDQKVDSSLESMTKNINNYFSDTNKKLVDLSSQTSANKKESENMFENLNSLLHTKINDKQLKTAINGIEDKIKSELEGQLNDDSMKRMASLNEYSSKLKEHIKDTDLKIKAMKTNIKQFTDHVAKSLPIKNFQVEKHKIFEKLSEQKSKIDELLRKNHEFVDFRKNVLENNQKTRQTILGVEDEIKRLREGGSNFNKLQNVSSILESLDPHLICEIGSEVKLHEKEIGKLEKQLIYLQNELQSAKNSDHKKMPEINNGKNSDQIIKIIKQYMANLDFEGRLKRSEKQLHDLSRKSDGINELEKKIYMLGKELDVSLLMKEIRKKSDDQTTRRQIRIVDSKIEKLFDFYKQVRKDIEDLSKRPARNIKQMDSVSLTTKKLHPPNCISCTPKPKSGRHYSRPKFEMSFDESIDHIKNSMYTKY